GVGERAINRRVGGVYGFCLNSVSLLHPIEPNYDHL
ncbi:MAG: hypothetical protein QG576_905, partial [Bacteroidota bacterium]|nr:hypothetical protein [Bacteroidota bacterium]